MENDVGGDQHPAGEAQERGPERPGHAGQRRERACSRRERRDVVGLPGTLRLKPHRSRGDQEAAFGFE